MEGVDAGAVNDFFLIICGIWVMFFKFGFTFVELGKTSGSNTANIIFKNLADTFITLMAYWLHGYAFAFGEGSGFIGSKYFLTLGSPNLCHFFFNYARCAVATTVALGAVIERTEPIGYLISSYVFAGFVYPIASHWVWDVHGFFNPLQSKLPVQDYGGSGVVFLVGGTVALVACYVIGARIDRWTPTFKQREHNLPLAALGASMQMMGFIGFIIGARYQITAPGEGQLAALCVLNILLAGASSGLYGLILQRLLKSYYDVDCFINTTIAGMVTVCAGANSYIPGISVMCGATSSFFYFIMEWLVLRNKIDDPLHVISIYLGSGVWGLIFAGFFSAQGTLGGTDKIIGNNLLAVVVLFSWTVAIMHPLFYVMKYVKVLRIPRFMEKQGVDKFRHDKRHPLGKRTEFKLSKPH
ncbi:putative ammonium transporter 1 isoform X2 [Acipenser ruthenus]|uniref:putative ammonium transporter 1 isoform X2 n=1 Tax=Acipenser ruthenus TaxID=7906 RepID=UPI00145BFFBC|nr:putative ammonium transporter 1 isoform X2 [Acipenser ruthenus]